MNDTLKIAPDLTLPNQSATWVITYLGKRGAGKTHDAAVQAEEMVKAGIPIIVIDGMGIFWGLRVSSDGLHEGLPVVVFGGEHSDLPLVPEKASEMAKAVVESNISCVLDLSPFSKYVARKIVGAFLDALYRLNRVERHVFIEESDLWAPQRPIGQEEAMCLSSVDNFVRRGGNHNLGCTLITQRSAVLNKDILTQSDCLVVLRTLAPQDKKAIQAWVEEQTEDDKSELNQWYDSLKTLENGEAWVWHPEKPPIFARVKFRQRETFHATREFIRSPRATEIQLMGVDEFVKRFKKVFESTLSVTDKVPTTGAPTLSEDIRRRLTYLSEQLLERDKKISLLELEKKRHKQEIEENHQNLTRLARDHFRLEKENAAYAKLKEAMSEFLPTCIPTPIPAEGSNPTSDAVCLQKVKTIIPLEEAQVKVPTIRTDTLKGKILALARDSFFSNWKSVGDVQDRLDELALGPITSQAVNGALSDLVKDGVLGMRHTDRNRWKLAPDVVFEDKKEAS